MGTVRLCIVVLLSLLMKMFCFLSGCQAIVVMSFFFLQPSSGVDQSGVTVSTSSSGLENPSDNSASGFYVTNPHNTITHNAASGGYSGFFYPILPAPIGLSTEVPISPSTRPLLKFDGNTAHSSGT